MGKVEKDNEVTETKGKVLPREYAFLFVCFLILTVRDLFLIVKKEEIKEALGQGVMVYYWCLLVYSTIKDYG